MKWGEQHGSFFYSMQFPKWGGTKLDVFERMILRRQNMDLGRMRVVNGTED
jgi:hypothetical protein